VAPDSTAGRPRELHYRYDALLDVSKSILAHRDLNDLFRDLSRLLRRVLRFDFLNLVLYDPALHAMRLHILETESPHDGPPYDYLPVSDSPSGWVWETQEPLVITDSWSDDRWPVVMDILRRNSIRTVCYVPLTTAQRRLGAIGFGYHEPDAASPEHVEFMQMVAGPVAVARNAAILLTDGSDQAPETAAYLARHADDTRIAVGGPADTADPTVSRALVGPDRYATSAMAALAYFPAPSVIGVATGLDFPDGLVAGPYTAARGGPVLLVPPTAPLPPQTSSYLRSLSGPVQSVVAYGGSSAVGGSVAAAVQGAVKGV